VSSGEILAVDVGPIEEVLVDLEEVFVEKVELLGAYEVVLDGTLLLLELISVELELTSAELELASVELTNEEVLEAVSDATEELELELANRTKPHPDCA
jgi:hypothetical protein